MWGGGCAHVHIDIGIVDVKSPQSLFEVHVPNATATDMVVGGPAEIGVGELAADETLSSFHVVVPKGTRGRRIVASILVPATRRRSEPLRGGARLTGPERFQGSIFDLGVRMSERKGHKG